MIHCDTEKQRPKPSMPRAVAGGDKSGDKPAIAQSNLRLRPMLPDRYIQHVFLHETMAHVSRC
jgi:hypothetical protein